MKRIHVPILSFFLLHCVFLIAATAEPVDLKPWALECYGLRGAVAVDSNTVVAVFGASCTGARNQAKAWRVRSEEDPAYAYEKFVQPKEAKTIANDIEFPFPDGFSAPGPAKNELRRYLVQLKLPEPLKPGIRYGLVAHGDGAPTTGAKTGCFFVAPSGADEEGRTVEQSNGHTVGPSDRQTVRPSDRQTVRPSDRQTVGPIDPETVRVPADDLAARMIGLRRASPLGDGKIALEFGASFSAAVWRDPAQYRVKINDEEIPMENFGRRSKIDVYLPIGWPFKVFLQHDVYLDLGRDLQPGDRITVAVGPKICAGSREAEFVFDPAATVTRSIQANQVGYLPDGPKVAYLGFWLGSFPESAKSAAANAFDLSTPPTLEEAFFVPPPEEVASPGSQVAGSGSDLGPDALGPETESEPPCGYDDLAPYALRFREPPPFELVREADGATVFSGTAKLTHNGLFPDGKANHSAENVYVLDFTEFAEPGRYYLRVPGVGRSIAFDLAADVYAKAFRVQSTGVFAQRCGIEMTPDRAPGWRRIACHTNGVQLTTVNTWLKNGFGPLRESPVPTPNPAYPTLKAAQDKLLADPALAARYPLEGDLRDAVAGSSAALVPLVEEKPGGTFVDDPSFGAKVFRTGRKNNGLAGTFAVDPDTGATVTFWLRRKDEDGNKLGGELFRFGPADKGARIPLDALWGVVRLGGRQWMRLGDDKWRCLAIRLGPVGDDGKMLVELFSNGERVAKESMKPPATDEFVVARATDDAAAGCHFRDLRFWTRPLAEEELATLADRAEPTIPKVIPLCGGHHDAGDYNPRCHIDVAQTLLAAWEHAPQKFTDGQLDIPEAGNGLPDVVDEALWSLKPWIALQDADGGVRAGTESAGDPNFYQTVELDPTGDFAYDKDCKASFIFAGVFAQASRVLAACGRKKEADEYLKRARRAYDWAVANVPEGLKDLRQYTEYRLDARAYAAAELLHSTGEVSYLADFRASVPWTVYPDALVRSHGRYDSLMASYAFLRDPKNETRDPEMWGRVRAAVLREADWYVEGSDQMAYKFVRHPDAPINWGTGAYGVHIRPVLAAWFITGDKKYRDWVIRTCDGALGANPLGLCWITGLGERTIRAPLHNSRYRPEGTVVDGLQGEGPVSSGGGYNYVDTVYPKHERTFASMHTFVDCHFAIGMDEGIVNNQVLDMALFGLLLPDAAPDFAPQP